MEFIKLLLKLMFCPKILPSFQWLAFVTKSYTPIKKPIKDIMAKIDNKIT